MAFGIQIPRKPDELAGLITDQVPAMLAYWDKDLVCRFANNAYVDWFGRTKEAMINRMRIDELLGPLYEKNLPYINGALSGKKQLFEREIPIPDGSGVRHSLATYIPDINNGEVLGFFVQVADVSSIKNLEKEIAGAKREILKKTIETEENEKRYLVEILSESVNQRLAACRMALENERKKSADIDLYQNVGLHISDIINEINLLCQELSPTEIRMLGMVDSIELYLTKMAAGRHSVIDFICDDTSIEKILLEDKFSVFRIIQNLVKIVLDSAAVKIKFYLEYSEPYVKIKLSTDCKVSLIANSKEYTAIACRVDYFSGNINEDFTGSESTITIEFPVSSGKSK